MEQHNELIKIKNMAKQIITCVEILEGKRTPISVLKLSTRAYNCLARHGIKYIEDLVKLEADDLWIIRNLGIAVFNEINEKVKLIGFDGWK